MATDPLAGVDVPGLAAAFGRAVHGAGIPCSPERSVRFARALALTRPASRTQLYWTARTVFVSAHDQVESFDAVFASVFDAVVDPADHRGDQAAQPVPDVARGDQAPPPGAPPAEAPSADGAPRSSAATASAPGDRDPDAAEREVLVPVASAEEQLARKDFGELDDGELIALRRLMADLSLATPLRRTRRARRARRGDHLDVRATLRASHRTGGDPVRQVRRRRRTRHRPLVVLCDISGSMEPYSRAFLTFLHGAVGGADAEAFVFATRLTRLTRALRGRHPDVAIGRAAAAAPDWSGGTRIGEALQRFNDRHGRRGMARGAVVVIVSDGWETGDPALVRREMERLHRLAHRIVWVNPRKAGRDFQPSAGGMAAALPSCDAFVGGHNLLALAEAIDEIGARR
ncbi:MAG TPA: VWA domain-containing protein [Baekduia sp.]|uniref:vWA domain-containing protein n=1 Tax=Baekduia sp. TaxID=2600305 RepID=UPI002C3F5480|nr:VWA domain-containing protein [Baekduia sp.]HMJ36204.1 VWA domain-containing protein [Baekduia sp.]